ncbi:MAG: bacterioferritin-associated ferredoxin [Phycisphaerales bacterium]
MDPDDHVCLCFRVSLRKVRAFVRREEPRVASQLSECLGAGTGCQWCVPFLRKIHAQWEAGEDLDLDVSPATYAARRTEYRQARRSATRDEPPSD